MAPDHDAAEPAVGSALGSEPEVGPSRDPFAVVTIGDNEVSLLRDGAQAYPAMLDAIARAKSSVCLEAYIFRDDATGSRFARALAERARAKVEVSLLYDDWGSSVSEETLRALRAAGVRVAAFRPVRWMGKVGTFLARLRRRNHRKSLIVDGLVAFTGGLNISDDYAAVADGGSGWRDTHVRIKGPAARELQALFGRTWKRSRGAPLDPARYPTPGPAGSAIRIVGNEFRKDRKDIRKEYVRAINRAARRIFLTQAYFLPPTRVLRALQRAARRGVEVNLILAAATDVRAVLYAARGLYGKLLKSGVRVFEWKGRILHAKTAVVDGSWCTVGSTNLDALSLRQNLEVNAVFEDERLGAEMEHMFAQDLYHCEQVTLEAWRDRPLFERILSFFAYRLRAWM